MVLGCPQSSLPIRLKLSSVMPCPVCWICPWIGEGCLRCFFFPQGSWRFPLCIPHCSQGCFTGSCRLLHFWCPLGSWSFGFMSACLIVELSLKWTCIPYICLMLSPIPFVYGITTWPTVFLLTLTLLFWLLSGLCYVGQYEDKSFNSLIYIFVCLRVIILHFIVCTVIHSCLSSGSLFFASLRQNNYGLQ